MKCLSIRQPWAAAILAGLIDVEYRCYSTDHRGELLIHASSTITDWDRRQLPLLGRRAPAWDELLFGKVIGVAELWACDQGRNGEWAWRFRNPRRLEPFEINPGRGLFEVETPPLVELTPSGRRASGKVRRSSAG